MEKSSAGGLPNKTQYPHLSMTYGYTPVDANPVFLNCGISEPQYSVEMQRNSIDNPLKSDHYMSRVSANRMGERKISFMQSFIHANCNYC